MAINSLIAQFGQNTFSGVGAAVDSANQAQQQRVRNAFAQREQEQQDTEFAQGQEDRQTAQQKVQQKEHMLTVYAEAKATKDPAQWAEKARSLATDEQDYNALIQAGPDETARVLGIHLGIPETKGVVVGGNIVDPTNGREIYKGPADPTKLTKQDRIDIAREGRAPAGPPDMRSPQQKIDDEVEKQRRINQDKAAQQTAAQSQASQGQIQTIDDAIASGSALTPDKIDAIFGTFTGSALSPTVRQSSVDAEAQRDNFVSMLSLAARGQLKGQGQVSDFEGKLLAHSATVLSNPRISPALAKQAVKQAIEVLSKRKTIVGPATPTNDSDPTPITEDDIAAALRLYGGK